MFYYSYILIKNLIFPQELIKRPWENRIWSIDTRTPHYSERFSKNTKTTNNRCHVTLYSHELLISFRATYWNTLPKITSEHIRAPLLMDPCTCQIHIRAPGKKIRVTGRATDQSPVARFTPCMGRFQKLHLTSTRTVPTKCPFWKTWSNPHFL